MSAMRRHALQYHYALAGIVLTAVVLAGCGNNRAASGETPRSPEVTVAAAPNVADPCAVVRIPHTGTEAIDTKIIWLQQQLRTMTDTFPYLERLGWAFVTKARRSYDPGFYTLAEQAALCLATMRPDSPESLLLHGHVMHNLHRFKEGEIIARRLVAMRGLSFDHGLLGDVLLEQGKVVEAEQAYQRMMDQKPGPQAYVRAAHVRWLTGDLHGAMELVRRAIAGFRDRDAVAWAQVELARYAWQAGDGMQALARVDRVLTWHADYAPALLLRGRLLLAEEQPRQALPVLRHAVRLRPLPEYQWVLIEALHAAGQVEEAERIVMALTQHGAANDRRTFALYLATTGQQIDAALRLAHEELEARADVFTLDTLAWAQRATGNLQQARIISLRAVAEGTQDARLFYHAGVIAADLNLPGEAARWLGKATALQHMLLPSERRYLVQAVAALSPQLSMHTAQ